MIVRVTNHPIVANLLLPPVCSPSFTGRRSTLYRTPFDAAKNWRRERYAVYLTNIALVAFIGSLGLVLDYNQVAAVQLPIMVCASIVGVWLFSVHHRFEGALWAPESRWNFSEASLRSTSHLRLPRVLQWFTGNIGFHHVHHIDPRIPNYRLEECHKANIEFETAPQLTLAAALRALRYTLWDSDRGCLMSFREAAVRRQVKLHRRRHEELHHLDLREEVPAMMESVDVAQRLERLRGDQMRTQALEHRVAWTVAMVMLTQLWVMIAWVFFRRDGTAQSIEVLTAILDLRAHPGLAVPAVEGWILAIIAIEAARSNSSLRTLITRTGFTSPT